MPSGIKMTTEEFIEKSNIKHDWKYDYSKTVYTKAKEKVCIMCPIHGEFWQTPDKHMNEGCGCPKCAKNVKYTTETFIEEAKKIHGDKYDYSKVNYVNNHTKVCIVDKDAGEFWQLPSNHLKGCGCNLNHGKRVWDTRGRITTKEFIDRAKKIHGDKYDYSLVQYKSIYDKVKIVCKKCGGTFLQSPNNHLNQKNGCPFCKQSKLEMEVDELLKTKGVVFEKQKHFPWLGKQSLDFYLSEYNIGIECQGEQHYKPVDFAGRGKEWAMNNFELVQKRDKRKKELCENNGVKIIYYSKLDKDIIL